MTLSHNNGAEKNKNNSSYPETKKRQKRNGKKIKSQRKKNTTLLSCVTQGLFWVANASKLGLVSPLTVRLVLSARAWRNHTSIPAPGINLTDAATDTSLLQLVCKVTLRFNHRNYELSEVSAAWVILLRWYLRPAYRAKLNEKYIISSLGIDSSSLVIISAR